MATHKGSEGTVKIGTDTVAEIKDWSITESGDTLEDTTMGDTSRTFQSSLTTFTGSLSCFWDEDDTAQGNLIIGASVALNVYPEGAVNPDTFYSGTAFVTSIDRNAAFDGMVEATFGFQGTGVLTEGVVPV